MNCSLYLLHSCSVDVLQENLVLDEIQNCDILITHNGLSVKYLRADCSHVVLRNYLFFYATPPMDRSSGI